MVSPDPRVVDTARVTTGAEGRGGAMGGATGRVMGGNTTESINLIWQQNNLLMHHVSDATFLYTDLTNWISN